MADSILALLPGTAPINVPQTYAEALIEIGRQAARADKAETNLAATAMELTVRDMVRLIGGTQRELREWMIENRWLIKMGKVLACTTWAQDNGYMRQRIQSVNRGPCHSLEIITTKGVSFLWNMPRAFKPYPKD